MKQIEKQDVLFEVTDVFGKKVRTSQNYWNKIFLLKHKEVRTTKEKVIEAIQKPDQVRKSLQDPYIQLFYKNIEVLPN